MSNTAELESEPAQALKSSWWFPHAPRQEQDEMLQFIEDNLDKRILLIEAPTGVGKSPVCMTLGKAQAGHVLTPQKILQDQYTKDWPEAPVIKGMSNYKCSISNEGSCETYSSMCNSYRTGACPYRLAKDEFFASRVGIANYSFLFQSLAMNPEGTKDKLESTEWLIFDEGHSLEQQLLNAAEVHMRQDLLESMNLSAPVKSVLSPDQTINFITPMLTILEKEIERIKDLLGLGKDKEPADFAGNLNAQKEMAKLNRVVMLASRCQTLLWDLREGVEWVCHSDGFSFRAKPLKVDGLWNKFIKPLNKKVLITSATMLPPETSAKWFGWEDGEWAYKRLSSPFPVNNRPIYFAPVAWLNKRNADTTIPQVANKIDQILNAYPNNKGVIHCHSFKMGSDLMRLCQNLPARVIWHQSNSDREQILKAHINSPNPTVLLSPSMTEGVDLKDDLARFVIIPKMPYPSLGDPWVKRRLDTDPEWYNIQVAMDVIQACGRAVRHSEDFADAFILDGNFKRLLDNYGYCFPQWVHEALVYS